jgi:hypothetical protein
MPDALNAVRKLLVPIPAAMHMVELSKCMCSTARARVSSLSLGFTYFTVQQFGVKWFEQRFRKLFYIDFFLLNTTLSSRPFPTRKARNRQFMLDVYVRQVYVGIPQDFLLDGSLQLSLQYKFEN